MRQKILRICIVAGLSIILLQIWLLPEKKGYIDLALIEPTSGGYKLASNTETNQNQTTIFPFLRNVMGKSLMINLSVYGQNEQRGIKIDLEINRRSTWILKNDVAAKSTEFESSWEIVPFEVYNITNEMEFLNLTLTYFESRWIYYGSVNIRLIR